MSSLLRDHIEAGRRYILISAALYKGGSEGKKKRLQPLMETAGVTCNRPSKKKKKTYEPRHNYTRAVGEGKGLVQNLQCKQSTEACAFLSKQRQTKGATMECHAVHSVSTQKCHMTHVRELLLIGTTGFCSLLAGSQPAIMLKEDTHTKEGGGGMVGGVWMDLFR